MALNPDRAYVMHLTALRNALIRHMALEVNRNVTHMQRDDRGDDGRQEDGAQLAARLDAAQCAAAPRLVAVALVLVDLLQRLLQQQGAAGVGGKGKGDTGVRVGQGCAREVGASRCVQPDPATQTTEQAITRE